jgi:hypothetical protein
MKNLFIVLLILLFSCKTIKNQTGSILVRKDSSQVLVKNFCDTLKIKDTLIYKENNHTIKLYKDKNDVKVKVVRDTTRYYYNQIVEEKKEIKKWYENEIIIVCFSLVLLGLIYIVGKKM